MLQPFLQLQGSFQPIDMPSLTPLSMTLAGASFTVTIAISYALWSSYSPSKRRQRLRQKLPANLDTWRIPGDCWELEQQIWKDLDPIFRAKGYTLWTHISNNVLCTPGRSFPLSTGFGYATPNRPNSDSFAVGSTGELRRFDYTNPLSRAARTRDGLEVIIRVVVLGNEGHDHLEILRRCATGENSLFSNNHVLPMLAEFQFEDITFGIFPKVGATTTDVYGLWARNSVGDIIEMLMQMLEALAFIHDLNIAHRDAFRDNFLVQWHPESLRTKKISPSRPRVYLIDFEVAIEFPADSTASERIAIGYPIGGSFSELEMYARSHAPELAPSKPYDPFKLDIWQLGSSYLDFTSTIPAIDEVLAGMVNVDPVQRLSAKEALSRLGAVVNSMTPESLLIEPRGEGTEEFAFLRKDD